MENIRCLLADIPQVVLADIIQKIVEARPGVEIIGRVGSSYELPEHIKDQAIDVVIYSMDETKPHFLEELFKISPQTVSVGLQKSGRQVCVCLADIGPEQLLNLIEEVIEIRGQGT